jgi:hypothetical protein
MTYDGTVQNGVIVLTDGSVLPEGTKVQIAPVTRPSAETAPEKPIGEFLYELALWAETQPCDLPEDLAINHDHYLYGVAKNQ